MFVGLEHVAIASPNPPSQAPWYVDHLGFTIILVRGGNYFVRASNGSLLEVTEGQGALAIQVSDFDAAFASGAERDVRFLAEPYGANGNRVVFFKDGEGNLCHLIQRKEPLP